MRKMGDHWAAIGTSLGSIMVLYKMIEHFFPYGFLHTHVEKYTQRILRCTNLYVQISIDEYTGELIDQKNQSYTFTEAYLNATALKHAMQLTACTAKNSEKLVLNMVDYEMTITDEFHGAKFYWMLTSTNEFGKPRKVDNDRSLTVTFHKRNRKLVMDMYLDHVMEKGRELLERNQQRKLYTNNSRDDWYKQEMWSHVIHNHPATFDNLAMDMAKKEDIIKDLTAFSKAKDYYAKIGKAWKRGYLLFGPPGTGKSTMIAAISKFLNYDIYDLELKSVRGGNSELRKLLLDTSDRSIIVIEDIDCSIELTNKRKKKKIRSRDQEMWADHRHGEMVVTLSVLLNFIDGLWSSTGGERLIIFTTNHVEKLDPALIRRGRMDKLIELGYCSFDGFKILAKNYLNIDDHSLFETIRCLISETQITPADVAENLMPKSVNGDDYSEVCLGNLICALEKLKEDT
ncbi:hypothetical protein MKW94_008333 [Papaver nudicaule]|uniref:AAA+ ATPase domain-containing protein n=1 Tax=Papaver nudicaule TaxID=74823 RepID=A0AA41VAT2_PAPNU|nr:hypothetical protein [Papaver nudicaule]